MPELLVENALSFVTQFCGISSERLCTWTAMDTQERHRRQASLPGPPELQAIITAMEQQLEKMQEQLTSAERERDDALSECGRLRGGARQARRQTEMLEAVEEQLGGTQQDLETTRRDLEAASKHCEMLQEQVLQKERYIEHLTGNLEAAKPEEEALTARRRHNSLHSLLLDILASQDEMQETLKPVIGGRRGAEGMRDLVPADEVRAMREELKRSHQLHHDAFAAIASALDSQERAAAQPETVADRIERNAQGTALARKLRPMLQQLQRMSVDAAGV